MHVRFAFLTFLFAVSISAQQVRPALDVWRVAGDDSWSLVPIAGNAPGAFNTHFRSDLTLINYRPVQQRVKIKWLAHGVDSYSGPEKVVTVPASSFLVIEDVVGGLLGQTGIGALEIKAVTSSDLLDVDAKIDATSRIWTAGGGGTYSQTAPAVSWTSVSVRRSEPTYLVGLRQDENFRTNIGIVNFDSSTPPRSWDVTVSGTRGSTSFTITAQPYSLIQVPLPAGAWGHLMITIKAQPATLGYWIAYGATVDNRTGDGWMTPIVQPSP